QVSVPLPPGVTARYFTAEIADRNGNKTTITRDAQDRVTQVTDTYGRTLTYEYNNALGKLSKVTDNAGRTIQYGYDADGNRTEEADANGDKTAYAYDAKHRLTKITYPNGGQRNYVYNSSGQVKNVVDETQNEDSSYLYENGLTEMDSAGRGKF